MHSPDPSTLTELDTALALVPSFVRPLTETMRRPLAAALGATLAADIIAPYALPPYDNTAVDGYAIRHADLPPAPPAVFKVIGESMAGDPFIAAALPSAAAIRIATGGYLPSSCDTVIMQEDCRRDGDTITILKFPALNSNIRRQGNDIEAGTCALASNHRLRPQDIALIGALGLTEIETLRPLRIAIASTGQELRPAGSALAHGQIIDTNALMLRQLLAPCDAEITVLLPLPDEYDATVAALNAAAQNYDLILTTGGVSVGGRDFVRDTAHSHGNVHLWKLAIKPGKPVLIAGFGECLFVGLPGNPVSAMVTFFLIVQPIIAAMRGRASLLPSGFPVRLGAACSKEKHLRTFPRARLEQGPEGLSAMPYRDQSSNLIYSLAAADGLLDLPLGIDAIAAGETVIFRPFSGLFW